MSLWNPMCDYNGDYALMKLADPDYPDDVSFLGVAILFGKEYREPYTGKQYTNNTGKPLVPLCFINTCDID